MPAVACPTATHSVAPNNTLKAPALAHADDIHELHFTEETDIRDLAFLRLRTCIDPNFLEVTLRAGPTSFEVAQERLGHAARFLIRIPELHRVVSVGGGRFSLHDGARSHFEHGNRDHAPLVVEDLGHSYLGSNQCVHRFLRS